MAYSIGMIKVKDVVVDRFGGIFEVKQLLDSEVAVCRKYRTNILYKLVIQDLRKHPFFS
jgi:hypothetical protein